MKDQKAIFNKGELSSGFNKTSIGTNLQDEKNILLDALDGDSSYIPRADTYAYAAFAGSLRMHKERKEKSTWQNLLLLINQLHEHLKAELSEISELIDQITQVCEDTLDLIDTLNIQMDRIRHNHNELRSILDHSDHIELEGETQNRHVLDMVERYSERTGKTITSEDDLRSILLAQMEYEQSVILPELQSRLNMSSGLYEQSMSVIERIEKQKNELEELVEEVKNNPDDSTIRQLESLQQKVGDLKAQAIKQKEDLSYKYDTLENNAVAPMSDDIEGEVSHEAPINLQSFGIPNSTPMP